MGVGACRAGIAVGIGAAASGGRGRGLEDEVVAAGSATWPSFLEPAGDDDAAVLGEPMEGVEVVDGDDRRGRGGFVVGEVDAELGSADVELDRTRRGDGRWCPAGGPARPRGGLTQSDWSLTLGGSRIVDPPGDSTER